MQNHHIDRILYCILYIVVQLFCYCGSFVKLIWILSIPNPNPNPNPIYYISTHISLSIFLYISINLVGVPVVEAPCEAESQCAELAKNGKVYGAATEDMDALTFRTPKLLRKMTFSGTKQPILEIDCELMLTGLGLSYPEFIDLCILCGCDYTDSIKGIGPKTALKLIRQVLK